MGAISVPEGIHGPLQLLLFAPPHSGLGGEEVQLLPASSSGTSPAAVMVMARRGADQFQVPSSSSTTHWKITRETLVGAGVPFWRWMVLNSGLRRDTCTVVHLS